LNDIRPNGYRLSEMSCVMFYHWLWSLKLLETLIQTGRNSETGEPNRLVCSGKVLGEIETNEHV
jgi:hypothetical protein